LEFKAKNPEVFHDWVPWIISFCNY
jgi:hypothetical protein